LIFCPLDPTHCVLMIFSRKQIHGPRQGLVENKARHSIDGMSLKETVYVPALAKRSVGSSWGIVEEEWT